MMDHEIVYLRRLLKRNYMKTKIRTQKNLENKKSYKKESLLRYPCWQYTILHWRIFCDILLLTVFTFHSSFKLCAAPPRSRGRGASYHSS